MLLEAEPVAATVTNDRPDYAFLRKSNKSALFACPRANFAIRRIRRLVLLMLNRAYLYLLSEISHERSALVDELSRLRDEPTLADIGNLRRQPAKSEYRSDAAQVVKGNMK